MPFNYLSLEHKHPWGLFPSRYYRKNVLKAKYDSIFEYICVSLFFSDALFHIYC